MLYRLWFLTVFCLSSVLFLTNVKAQAGSQPYRLNDKDVERIIRRIELRSDQFRSNLDSALDKRGNSGHMNTFFERFSEQVKRLRKQFNKHSSSTADVRAVLDRAAPIDEFMTRNRLSSEAQNDWTLLRNKLDQLALAYNVKWRWDTYRSDDLIFDDARRGTFSLVQEGNDDDSNEESVAALAEIICRAGDEAAAALFVLMGVLENSAHPKLLANTVKPFAFTRCAELNLYGMVDAQLPLVEGELLATDALG